MQKSFSVDVQLGSKFDSVKVVWNSFLVMEYLPHSLIFKSMILLFLFKCNFLYYLHSFFKIWITKVQGGMGVLGLGFGPGVHNFGWLKLLRSDGALLTSLDLKSLNSGCFFAVGKLKSWNGGSQLQGELLFKQSWTLYQSLRHLLSQNSPLEHPVTVQWRAIFHS